ncbi:MAG: response regulator [Armatimonadetes bacterium]|nr:response regulator [Armatimonadota bacterium]MBS1728202.1 response regulator [Armatimonadota bacterium]
MSSKILVVDDEACILKMMELVLANAGYSVETADNPREALGIYGNGANYDLVITDYKMPEMTGIELEAEILRRDPSAKVLIVSGYGGIETALEAINKGATDFLRKPFTPDALRNAVRSALERDRKLSPVTTVCREFSRQSVNGTSFELKEKEVDEQFGDLTCKFEVSTPGGMKTLTVVMPAYIQELIRAYIDSEDVPCGGRFFEAICEETVANELKTSGGVPRTSKIVIDNLTKDIQKWIDSMVSVAVAQ